MIRRGLQILIVGITALGAAPSFCQTSGTSPYDFPQRILLQGFANHPSLGDFNGLYDWVLRDETFAGGTRWYAQFGEGVNGTQSQLMVRVEHYGSYFVLEVRVRTQEWTVVTVSQQIPVSNGQYPVAVTAGWSNGYSGEAYLNVSEPDPYYENFPDWESAGVKIPLGFTFGMSVWAAFLAATIALKWVRELSSAAT